MKAHPLSLVIHRSLLVIVLSCVCAIGSAREVDFDRVFTDSTLRIDYIFSGTNRTQHIAVDQLSKTAVWYGRRHRLNRLPLEGNGQLTVLDASTGDTLYRHSFSTLFQEWQETEEARHTEKSFENTFLIPMPKRPVDVVCQLVDTHRRVQSSLRHRIDPRDILIRDRSGEQPTRWKYVRQGGDPRKCINVAFVAEGYAENQMKDFLAVCDSSIMALQAHEPFRSMIDRFNFIAVMPVSKDNGVSIPHLGIWKNTALSSSFDTFYSNRYLTTLHIKRLYDVMTGIPFEHFIILANTSEYGGGGIYNSYNMAAAKCSRMRYEVIVHEFGHSFGGLGDEYAYGDDPETHYPSDTEPWEPNLTTLHHFTNKWEDMITPGTAIPTKPDGRDLTTKVGVYEGAGYQSKGVYRPAQECRMKVNEVEEFCPVCQRALRRMIEFYTNGDQQQSVKAEAPVVQPTISSQVMANLTSNTDTPTKPLTPETPLEQATPVSPVTIEVPSLAPTTQQVTPTPQTPTTQQVTPPTQTPTTQQVTPTSQKDTPTKQPATPTKQPTTPAVQPTPNNQPTASRRRLPMYRENVPTDSIILSDPCILADSATHTYYMTGTGGLMWTSKDLRFWNGPRNVVEIDSTSWMGAHPQIWAAELHQYKGKYYYFATFTNNAITIDSVAGRRIPRRACHVLVSDKPDGPYRPMKDPVYLPAFKPTLDGTLWVDTDGHPYLVYCHEWLQNLDGTIEKIRLSDDLSGSIGSSQLLFRASDAPWTVDGDVNANSPAAVKAAVAPTRHFRADGSLPNVVTDGPWLFRTQTGRLGMIWTSWVGKDYTMGVVYSQSGTLDGPWIHEPKPLTPSNYGHGMLFHDWKGRLLLSVHSHEVINGRTVRRPHFFLMDDEDDRLKTLAHFRP